MNLVHDIPVLFEKIATTDTRIGHDPIANVFRFYGYNMDEAVAEDADNLSYPRMGLALKTHAGLTGRFENLGGALRNNLYTEVVILDEAATNDYPAQEAAYTLTYGIMMDIATWILNQASTDPCQWPVIGLVDVSNITYSRVGPVGTGQGFGFKLMIQYKDMVKYTSSNPLNGMTP